MSTLVIDTTLAQTATDWDALVQLDGVQYLLDFLWNPRAACWYLGIYDQQQNPIAVGLKMVVSWNLIRRFVDPRLPTGILMCVDMSGMGIDISAPTDLGQRVLFEYITADDVATVQAGGALP